jgi:hypothetical protein
MNEQKLSLKTTILNLKWWQSAILGLILIGILLAAAYAASQGANVTISLELQARLDYLEVQQQLLNETINIPVNSTVSAMVKEANYIVTPHDSYYCLINGTDDRAGRLEYYSTNATKAEQFSLGNMTSGLVYMKEVQHNSSLTIGATQSEWVQYQGSMTFINATGSYEVGGGGATGPAGPAGTINGLPFDYMIFNNATATYMINGTGGTIPYYSTNASAVFNNCVGNLSLTSNRGTIFVKTGNYSLTNTILFNGGITGAYGRSSNKAQFRLIGEGKNNTVFIPSANVDAITLQNYAPVYLADFGIHLPETSSGNGIAGYNVTGYNGPSTEFSILSNLYITGCSAGKWGIYLENPSMTDFNNLYSVTNGAGCIALIASDNLYPWGDCSFTGTNVFTVNGANQIGIACLRGTGSTSAMNLIGMSGYNLFLSDSKTNTTAFWGDHLNWASFKDFSIQGYYKGIYLDNADTVEFDGNYFYQEATVMVDASTHNAKGCIFKNFAWTLAGNSIAFNDGQWDPRLGMNVYENWMINGGYNVNNTVTIGTLVRDIYFLSSATRTGFSGSPVGYIANPVDLTSGMYRIVDYAGASAIANNTLYTVLGNPKNIFLTGGAFDGPTYNCTINGQVIFSNLATGPTMMIHLVAGDTILFGWSSAPPNKVYGE